MSTPGGIGVCFECLPLVNKLPHCRMMDFTLFGNGNFTLPSNNCFSKIIADVLPPWHCVNTHLKAPDSIKTSAFEVLTLADEQLIKGI